MDLRKPAAWFETTKFEAYNESLATWTPEALTAKLLPIDRFLSNFNRPTKRRLLSMNPSDSTPDSNTIRVPETGEIYFLGEPRTDSRKEASYDKVLIAHRSGTLGTVNRRVPAGPSNDPGWLTNTVMGSHYMDVELRAASKIDEQREQYEGDYFAMLPPHADLENSDQLLISGDSYMVETSYMDSGFRFARAVKRADHRLDFVYHSRGAGAGYDPTTRAVTDGLTDYNVTGFALQRAEGQDKFMSTKTASLVVVVEQGHIGVIPTDEDELTWDGQRYNVEEVKQDFVASQYHIHCTL